MRSKRHCISSVCRFYAFHSQTSDIRHQTSSLGYSQALRQSEGKSSQVKSNRVVDPTSRAPVVHSVSKIRWWVILTIDESWLDSTCWQIKSWNDLAARWRWGSRSREAADSEPEIDANLRLASPWIPSCWCHVMPCLLCQKERCSRPPTISEIFLVIFVLGVEWRERWKRLVVHADNTRPHSAKVARMFCDDNFLRIAPHSPYSPDLASSNSFLFENLKTGLHGQ
jgi:hypothetical protein